MSTPTDAIPQVASLCSIGMRTYLMTGFLREWLIDHFASGKLEHAELRSLMWKANPLDSNILIQSVTEWNPKESGKRPEIVIRRNDLTNERLSIGDKLHGTFDLTGQDHYSTMEVGSHTLFCGSKLPQEAEILSMEVARDLRQFGPSIREELDLRRFRVLGVGSLRQLEEASQTYSVPVTVAYAYEESWILHRHAPFLKRINIKKMLP